MSIYITPRSGNLPAPIPLVNMQKNMQGILTRAGKEHKLQDMNKTTSLAQDIPPTAKVLVDRLVSTGCTIKEASKVAGYKGNSARVSASKMLHKPEVQKYMMARIQQTIGISSAKAVNKLMSLSAGAKSEYVQLEASKDILDRAGFKAPDKHQHLVAGDFKVTIDLG